MSWTKLLGSYGHKPNQPWLGQVWASNLHCDAQPTCFSSGEYLVIRFFTGNTRGEPLGVGDRQEGSQGLTTNIREKSLHASSRRRSSLFETARAFCSCCERGRPSRETTLPGPNSLGFYQSLTNLGEEKYPIPAPCSHPTHLRRGTH